MWLLHMEKNDGVEIMHDHNTREYRLPKLHHFSMDGYSTQPNTVFEFCVSFWQFLINHSVTLSPRVAILYPYGMMQITRAGY